LPQQKLEQTGFASAVGTDDGNPLARLNGEADGV